MQFILENLATIILSALLAGIVGLILGKMVSNKRKGKSACGCDCASCPSGGVCRKPQEQAEN